jgi:hypothetical protein
MRKMIITIEYELDDPTTTLESERQDWIDGNVDVYDVIQTDGKVRFVIEEDQP